MAGMTLYPQTARMAPAVSREQRMPHLGGSRVAACATWAVLLLATGATSCARDPYPGIRAVPAADLAFLPLASSDFAGKGIRDVEGVTDSDGELHVVWQTYRGDSSGIHPLWYSHAGSDHSQWSKPQLVEASDLGKLRLVVANSQLHLFGGRRGLRHLVRDRSSGGWRDEGLISRTADRVEGFDALATGSGIVVAYTSHWLPDPDADFKDTPTKLVVAELHDGGQVEQHDIATLPHSHWTLIADPSLARWRNETHVVWSTGTMDTVRGGLDRARFREASQATSGGPWTAPRSRVVAAYRESTGGAWTSSTGIWPEVPGRAVRTLALVATGERLFMFFNGNEASESTDGRHWSSPVRLDARNPWTNTGTERTFAASADSDAIVVTWIDGAIGASRLPPIGMSNRALHTDALAMVCSGRPVTLANLMASPMVRITPTSRLVRGVIAPSDQRRPEVVWFAEQRHGSDWSPEIGVARLSATSLR